MALISVLNFLIVSITFTNSLDCDDYRECASDNEIKTFNGNSINCRGFESCASSQLDAINNVYCDGDRSCISANTITAGTNIYCNADFGCADLNRAGSFINAINGNIYCNGNKSCISISLKAGEAVHCIGHESCFSSLINTTNVVCSGSNSCENCAIHANGIFEARGSYSFKSSFIIGAEKVYCRDPYSCHGVHIEATYVYLEAENSTAYGSIYAQSSFCRGYKSCFSSVHILRDTFNAIGEKSAVENVVFAKIVNGFGDYSLQKANIYGSNNAEINTLTVNLSGFHAGDGATIHCESVSECNINCEHHGCENTFIFHDNRDNINIKPYNCIDWVKISQTNPSLIPIQCPV